MDTLAEYMASVLKQALAYYRNTKLTEEDLRNDIKINWPSQVVNSDLIVTKCIHLPQNRIFQEPEA